MPPGVLMVGGESLVGYRGVQWDWEQGVEGKDPRKKIHVAGRESERRFADNGKNKLQIGENHEERLEGKIKEKFCHQSKKTNNKTTESELFRSYGITHGIFLIHYVSTNVRSVIKPKQKMKK